MGQTETSTEKLCASCDKKLTAKRAAARGRPDAGTRARRRCVEGGSSVAVRHSRPKTGLAWSLDVGALFMLLRSHRRPSSSRTLGDSTRLSIAPCDWDRRGHPCPRGRGGEVEGSYFRDRGRASGGNADLVDFETWAYGKTFSWLVRYENETFRFS